MQVQFSGVARDFLPSQLSVRTLSWCPYTPMCKCKTSPAEGLAAITALFTVYKIRQTREWPTLWTQSLVISLPKIGHLQQCQNCRKISLIRHPSKGMLKIRPNRWKPKAEKIIAEEQAGFRAGRSTTEQTINLLVLHEKHLLTPARPIPYRHRLKEGLQQGLACLYGRMHEEVQHQCQPYLSHQTPL